MLQPLIPSVCGFAKILFHVHKKFGEAIPDSALLIVVGLVLGFGLKQLNVSDELYYLNSHTFFSIFYLQLFLMPAISCPTDIGTIWNTVAIGSTLLVLGQFNLFSVQFTPFEILLFAALISAVDPVAVIAVFEEVHVNEFYCYVNVFGEALFNDGVTVVLYTMFQKFIQIGEEKLIPLDYVAGGLSFFVISLGGIFIGITFAALVSLATRFTDRVKILAPVFIFVIPYLSYLTAEIPQAFKPENPRALKFLRPKPQAPSPKPQAPSPQAPSPQAPSPKPQALSPKPPGPQASKPPSRASKISSPQAPCLQASKPLSLQVPKPTSPKCSSSQAPSP
uniref:Cation/H+ exchanger domain-containing protein n=1 Tax=Ditylenchus dipsaci TaxID=166011 RepID=A0A915EL10_9BILA